jgi:uncharacterized sulfatase
VNNIKLILQNNFSYILSASCLIVGIRTYEFFAFSNGIINYSVAYFFQGIFFDLLFLLNITALLSLFQIGISFISKPISNVLFHVKLIALIFFQFGISYYFVLSQTPLDESVFFLNWTDLIAVIDLKYYLNFSIVSMVTSAILVYFLLGKLFKKIKVPFKIISVLSIIGILTIPFNFYTSSKNDKTICVNNRINYFIQRSIIYIQSTDHQKIGLQPTDFASLNPKFYPAKIENNDFPFFHKLDTSKDFANNFNLDKKNPPNIVLIIVESLNSYFIGNQPKEMVQLMPFLSDLSTKSLYFKNTLSTCERTFNVLPTTMASLPIAPDRISAMTIDPMPLQFGLPNLLKKNYHSRFYCGLYLSFTNMNGYMNYLKTDYLIDRWEPMYKKRNKDYICDGDVFKQSFDDEQHSPTKKRKLDVFLTYNTHEPFIYPQKNRYKNNVISLVKQSSQLPKERAKHLLENAVKFGSYAYLDDQLREYFQQASKNKEHQNTIYFIVGDHGSELCSFDNIARFHTSLLVYSPLLKKAKVSNEIVSQLDIAPSIINLLKNYPALNLPDKVAFNGKTLAIKPTMSHNRFLVFKGNNTNLLAALYGKYYYDRDQLYTYSTNLKLKEIKNESVRSEIKAQLATYNKMSSYVFFQNKLLPPIYSKKYIDNEQMKPFFQNTQKVDAATFSKNEFFSLAKCPEIAKKTTLIATNVSLDLDVKVPIKYDDLPVLVVTFYDKNKEKPSYYKGIQAVPSSTQVKNGKMKLEFKSTVQLKDFKRTKDTNFEYYIYNPKKKEFKVNQADVNFYIDKK